MKTWKSTFSCMWELEDQRLSTEHDFKDPGGAAMPTQIIPVIMCGEAGTRLWPVSRESMPKQFVSLRSLNAYRRRTSAQAPARIHRASECAQATPRVPTKFLTGL